MLATAQTRRPPGPHQRYPTQFIRQLMRDKQALFNTMSKMGDVTQIRFLGFIQSVRRS